VKYAERTNEQPIRSIHQFATRLLFIHVKEVEILIRSFPLVGGFCALRTSYYINLLNMPIWMWYRKMSLMEKLPTKIQKRYAAFLKKYIDVLCRPSLLPG